MAIVLLSLLLGVVILEYASECRRCTSRGARGSLPPRALGLTNCTNCTTGSYISSCYIEYEAQVPRVGVLRLPMPCSARSLACSLPQHSWAT